MFGGGIGIKYGLPRPDGLKAPLASQRAYIDASWSVLKCLVKLRPTWSFDYPPLKGKKLPYLFRERFSVCQ